MCRNCNSKQKWHGKQNMRIYIYIYKRNVQLGNVASRVTIVRTVTFDKGVVVWVIKTCGVDGCSTAWFPTCIPLI